MITYPFTVRFGDSTGYDLGFHWLTRQLHIVLYLMQLLHMLLYPKPLKTTMLEITVLLVFVATEASVRFLGRNDTAALSKSIGTWEIMFPEFNALLMIPP